MLDFNEMHRPKDNSEDDHIDSLKTPLVAQQRYSEIIVFVV